MDVEELVKNYSWMVRPCQVYDEEYKDCRSIKSRFHQRFVEGTFSDCSHWKNDYDNCVKWKDSSDPKAFKDLIDSETKRREARLAAHHQNDVWERREAPPEDWNAPLPDWMEKKMQESYLAAKSKEMKEGNASKDRFCVIS